MPNFRYIILHNSVYNNYYNQLYEQNLIMKIWAWLIVSSLAFVTASSKTTNSHNAGVGIADITGPAAEIGMMGYAALEQITNGIHMRQFSRAFIFDDDKNRVVFVSADVGMMGHLVKREVINRLENEFGDLYTQTNVVLSGTHTHSGPAGYFQYLLFDISCLGFIQQTYEAIVSGVVESIRRAHKNIKPSNIYYTEGKLYDSNINRSPTSYEANPEEEKLEYEDGNTDKIFSQLHIISTQDNGEEKLAGVLNWFAVHPTSMPNSNQLISGDNKGYASYLFEKKINGESIMPGKGDFVAAFASTNHGDVSPNLDGPKCIDTGEKCDLYHSTCNGRVQNCIASGPGKNPFESTQIIGEKQFDKSFELYSDESKWEKLVGDIRNAHQFVDMSNYDVVLENGTKAHTCPSAMGYSFAAGTTDGPGEFDFTQGTNSSNTFWDFVSGLLVETSEEQKQCHYPKPILLNTGKMNKPYMWHPNVIDTQVLKIGQVIVAAVPGEFTTMSGRRMRKAIKKAILDVEGDSDSTKVMIAGLSNMYTHYITTFEEYQKQRYEAASTIFGPHTLRAYLQQFSYLTKSMYNNSVVTSTIKPPDLSKDQISLVPVVLFDYPGVGHKFGECTLEPEPNVEAGNTVITEFVSGHPRNNLLLEDSFLEIRRIDEDDETNSTLVAVDGSWETKMKWTRTNRFTMESRITITWDIPENTLPGTYYITHKGYYKALIKSVHPYEGKTQTFKVVSKSPNRASRYTSLKSLGDKTWTKIDKTIAQFIKNVTSFFH
nr:LOW QUALITY PROTEIN: neutral ceramidase-like [Lepeophtheirus salmonis]